MPSRQLLIPFPAPATTTTEKKSPLIQELLQFKDFGSPTMETMTNVWSPDHGAFEVPTYTNEFWTAKQRAAHSLHEISYRACFKPQLPRFFIERLTGPGGLVYDPFMGRGTTVLEAGLLGRRAAGCDISPLSDILTRPRFAPPRLQEVTQRLEEMPLRKVDESPEDLLVFYHPDTLREICALKRYLREREASGELDAIDSWIRMVAVNRLTGHSTGFFSVYTMPPNQAVSVEVQRKINRKRDQQPEHRDVKRIILKKSASLLSDCDDRSRQALRKIRPLLLTGDSAASPRVRSGSVNLVVTSPPFLDVVNYASDNWLRCWFIGVDPSKVQISILKRVEDWQAKMATVLKELRRELTPGGHVAFEVGEVRGGKVRLEEAVIPSALASGLEPVLILINQQRFTKTANCWGVDNNQKGTNTNRVVLLRKCG